MIVCFRSNNNFYPNELKPFLLRRDTRLICEGGKLISAFNWSMKELNVPCYPEERVFLKIKQELKEKYSNDSLSFYITGKDINTVIPF